MKVRIDMTIEVDKDKWNAEYGENDSAAQIREAVKGAVHTAIRTNGIVVNNSDEIITDIWEN